MNDLIGGTTKHHASPRDRTRKTLSGRLAAGLVLILLSGCATVSISTQDGSTRVERHFGVVSVELAPATKAVVAEVSSLGYLGGPMGISLGYGHGIIAALPAECRLVVWLDHPEQAEKLKALLTGYPDLCVINRHDSTKEGAP